MDTLISVGTLAAWTWSIVVLAGNLAEDTYFEAAAVITTLILLGRYLEARAKRRSGGRSARCSSSGAKEARVLRDGEERAVPIEDVAVGDLLVVRPGEKVAADGVVVEGESAVDQSLLTGESVPVEVEPGSEVAGATINTYGRLVVRATQRRRRHGAGPDRPAGRSGAVRQGARPAARRPGRRASSSRS